MTQLCDKYVSELSTMGLTRKVSCLLHAVYAVCFSEINTVINFEIGI